MMHRNEHMLVALVEAQTRAMNRYYEDPAISLQYERFDTLLREVAKEYFNGADMNAILERVLDWNEPFVSDAERHGYKVALGIEFQRRKQAGIAIIENLERTRPFAPR